MAAFGPFLRKSGDHIMFWCPACESGHVIRLRPGGWEFRGPLERPSITPSFRAFEPANTKRGTPEKTLCHLYVKNGELEYRTDSPHAFAGKTIPMQPIPPEYGGLED